MITKQLFEHGRGLIGRFGAGWVVGCAALGCLLPCACVGGFFFGVLLLLMEWR